VLFARRSFDAKSEGFVISKRVARASVFTQRGEAEFGRVTLRTCGPLKLVRKRYRMPEKTRVRVVPDLAKVAIEAERILRGDAGAKARQQISRGRDFDSLREYQRGDDPRYIEWKASARSRSLVVKRMIPEQRQDVFVLAESARHCMGKNEDAPGGERRIDVLVGAALHLSAAALSKGDHALARAASAGGVCHERSCTRKVGKAF